MNTYVKRTELTENHAFNGSVRAYHGPEAKTNRGDMSTYVVISDCNDQIRLHSDGEEQQDLIDFNAKIYRVIRALKDFNNFLEMEVLEDDS